MNEEVNFCSQCGVKISSGAKFCSNCGHDLKNSSTKITLDKAVKVEVTNATGKGLEKGYGFIFNGLTEALKENLSHQKKGGDFIVTEVKIDNGEVIQVVQANGAGDISNPSFPGLAIVLPVVDGKIKAITDYGAFVDLGGYDSLLHSSDITYKRIAHPSEVLKIDQKVKVKIIKVDPEKNRVSVGMKQLEEDPWHKVKDSLKINDRVNGVVTNVTDYGIFIEVENGMIQI